MRGAGRALAALRRALLAAAPAQPGAASPLQPLQLQRGFSSAGGRAAGAAAAAAAGGRAHWLAAVAVGLSAGLGLQLFSGPEPAQCKAAEKEKADPKGRLIDKDEVAKHRTKETGARCCGDPAWAAGGVCRGGVPAKPSGGSRLLPLPGSPPRVAGGCLLQRPARVPLCVA